MVATVNASTSSGVIVTSDTSGALALQTASTTAVTIDTSQNVGVGVTPSAWGSGYKALQVFGGSVMANTTYLQVGANNYFNGTNDIYINTGYAVQYQQNLGKHIWLTAPSGTAGNAITFTQAMTLNASGNLTFGTSNAGIIFNNSSALTNSTLNDYETGTYTVTATPQTSGSITLNASNNTATYTKIGRQVLVTGEIIVSSVSSPVGAYVNLNLPFTSSNLTQRSSYAVATMVGGVAASPTPTVYFIYSNVATIQVIVNASTINSDYRFDFSISYTANF